MLGNLSKTAWPAVFSFYFPPFFSNLFISLLIHFPKENSLVWLLPSPCLGLLRTRVVSGPLTVFLYPRLSSFWLGPQLPHLLPFDLSIFLLVCFFLSPEY